MKTLKKLFAFLTLFLIFRSCNQTPKNENTNAENEKFVKAYFELFNQHKWQELANMYADNAEFKDPSLGNEIVKQTKTQFIKKYTELNQIFPNLKDTVIQVYASGEKNIIVEFVSTGMAPDNSKFELPICTIFTIENGKITKDFTYYDNFDEAVK